MCFLQSRAGAGRTLPLMIGVLWQSQRNDHNRAETISGQRLQWTAQQEKQRPIAGKQSQVNHEETDRSFTNQLRFCNYLSVVSLFYSDRKLHSFEYFFVTFVIFPESGTAYAYPIFTSEEVFNLFNLGFFFHEVYRNFSSGKIQVPAFYVTSRDLIFSRSDGNQYFQSLQNS